MSIHVNGRPKLRWTVTATPLKGVLSIRLDDLDDPEYWQVIHIPHHDLLVMLARVHALTYAPDTVETLTEIDAPARMLGFTPVDSGE